MKKIESFVCLYATLAVCFFFGWSGNALAQNDEDIFMLEEVTVTAQKRSENQQKVAIAMDVVSGEELGQLGKNDIDEILTNVSSVKIQSSTDGLRVSIRGISNDNAVNNNVQASTPTVAVNTDGVYTNRNGGNTAMYDVERVEVLFGPQSTMYASGSPGGIVNVVTANPKLDDYSGSGTIEYGSYNLLHTAGSINVPVNDVFAFRGAFSTTARDGYLSNGSNDEEKKSGRMKFLYEPNEKLSMVMSAELTRTGGVGYAAVEAFVDQDDQSDPWTSEDEAAGMGREDENKRFTAHIDYDFGYAGTLSIIPSYTDMKNQSAGNTSFTMMDDSTDYYITLDGDGFEEGLEMRMASSEEFPFKWIVGVNYYKSEDEQWQVDENQTDPNEETEYTHAFNQQITKAVYANVTYPLTEVIRATLGARQSWDENNSYNWEKPGKGGSSDPTTETFSMEYDDPNFKLGIEYDLAENSMLYADISSSYRMNGGAGAQKELDPEELTAYSIGAKNRFMDNRLQLNASAYFYEYKNYFANMDPARVPVDSDGDGVYDGTEELVNMETGDARIYGFDIQTTTIITDKDKLDLNISYVKKEFTDLFFDLPDIINSYGIDDLDYNGKEMPQAPNWNITANYSHNFVLPNGGSLTPRLEASYTSKYVLNWMAKSLTTTLDEDTGVYSASVSDTSDVRWQEAYVLGNISIVYASPDGNWSLTGYVKNIDNYAVKQFLSGQGSMSIGSPRTIGVSVSAKF